MVEVVGGVVSLEVVADEEEAVAGLLNDGKVVEEFDSDNSTLVIVTIAVEIKFGFIISAAFGFKDVKFKVLKLTVVKIVSSRFEDESDLYSLVTDKSATVFELAASYSPLLDGLLKLVVITIVVSGLKVDTIVGDDLKVPKFENCSDVGKL